MPTRTGPVHVAVTRRLYKGKVYESYLLRRTYRVGKQVKHETLGNISHLPLSVIEIIRRALKGETFHSADESFGILRSLPHGHVAAVLGTMARLELDRILGTGDRGMITEARIREELQGEEGLDWITALKAPSIRRLVDSGSLQLSLFDTTDMGEIRDPSHPNERLIVCRNPLLAAERARKREDLLRSTEEELGKIVQATMRTVRRVKDEGSATAATKQASQKSLLLMVYTWSVPACHLRSCPVLRRWKHTRDSPRPRGPLGP